MANRNDDSRAYTFALIVNLSIVQLYRLSYKLSSTLMKHCSTRSQGILISENSSVLKDLMGNGETVYISNRPVHSTYTNTNVTKEKVEESYDCNKTSASELEQTSGERRSLISFLSLIKFPWEFIYPCACVSNCAGMEKKLAKARARCHLEIVARDDV